MKYFERELKIRELEMRIEYMKKEFEVKKRELEAVHKEAKLEQSLSIARLTITGDQLRARLEESPSKLLQEILKALTVKIPTLNIESLSVSAEKK